MLNVYSTILVITLNVNDLNASIRRQIVRANQEKITIIYGLKKKHTLNVRHT